MEANDRNRYERIFVRHLQTDKNSAEYADSPELQRAVRSRKNVRLPVNERGHEEGRLLSRSFAPFLVSRGIRGPLTIYHSDLERTRTTASYILKGIERRPDAFSVCGVSGDDRIRDIDHGLTNDIPYEAMREMFPDYARDIDALGYLDARPPKGESHREALPRIKEFLADLSLVKSDTVTVTHLSTLILIRMALEGLSDAEVLEMLSGKHPPNASVTRYRFDASTGRVTLLEADALPWAAARRHGAFMPGAVRGAQPRAL